MTNSAHHQVIPADQTPPARIRPGISILALKRHRSGSLLGFIDVRIEQWQLTIFGCTVYALGARRWIGLPGRALLTPDRKLVLDQKGKVTYTPSISFSYSDRHDAFQAAALAAITSFCPGLFDQGGGP